MNEQATVELVVVELKGNPSSLEIQRRLLALPRKGVRTMVLDLSGVQAVDASVLGAILLLCQALGEEGGELRVRGCSPLLLDAFELLRFERLICVER